VARIDAKCLHLNTTKGNIKCCQNCKLSRKVARQNCRQCYDKSNSACRRTDAERAITGLWTTEKVKKALEKDTRLSVFTMFGILNRAALICGRGT